MIARFALLGISLALTVALSACGATAQAEEGKDSVPAPTDLIEKATPNSGSDVEPHQATTSMRVLWTISGYVIGSDFTGDKQAAEAMLFKPLDMTDTAIIFDGQACEGTTFQRETVKTAEFLSSSWSTSPQALGIDSPELQVVKTNCGIPGFQEYVRLADGRLIVPIDGVFYFFAPKRNY